MNHTMKQIIILFSILGSLSMGNAIAHEEPGIWDKSKFAIAKTANSISKGTVRIATRGWQNTKIVGRKVSNFSKNQYDKLRHRVRSDSTLSPSVEEKSIYHHSN